IEDGSMTIDMNNPTCGDRIRLTLDVVDNVIKDAKFEGEGCSISMSSASMMSEAVKGHTIEKELHMSQEFSNMMREEHYEISNIRCECEVLSGVSKFPVHIKCATLA